MKVYVDSELPKQCHNCRFRHKDLCCITNDYFLNKDCPLQSLTDYTKQVRKEVCEEIKEKLKPKEIFHPEDEFEIDYDFYYKEDVESILNQIY